MAVFFIIIPKRSETTLTTNKIKKQKQNQFNVFGKTIQAMNILNDTLRALPLARVIGKYKQRIGFNCFTTVRAIARMEGQWF